MRLSLAFVFVLEAIALILPGDLGAGRFAKIGISLPKSMGPFVGLVELACGSLSMTHETRTDFAMLMGSIFILPTGPGRWSLDAKRWRPQATSLDWRHETKHDISALI